MDERKVYRKRITRKAVREYLADDSWSEFCPINIGKGEGKINIGAGNTFHVHENGPVINRFHQGEGMLYASWTDFKNYWQSAIERSKEPRMRHVLSGRFPYGEEFPEHVDALVDDLAQRLKIDHDVLDNSFESLKVVESKVRRMGRKKASEPAIFSGLIAYTGEVMRTYLNGRWEMLLERQTGTTWEPWIVDPDGNYCQMFIPLYDSLFQNEVISIASATGVMINRRSKRRI